MIKLALCATALLALAASAHAGDTLSPLPIHAGGAVAKDGQDYIYQWPGVYFESRFHGTSVTVRFDDDKANYNVILDGKPLLIAQRPGQMDWTVSALDGDHTIRVEKRSETQYDTGRFGGFFVADGKAAMPAPAYSRAIEYIGDSLTVGYGNTSQYTQCTKEDIFQTTDAQEGFGPIVAKHYNADYRINAFSGLGMVRNYGGFEHPKYHMPMLYPRAVYDDPLPASRTEWKPQIIVVGIGGNDFSTPVGTGEPWADQAALQADYEKTYLTFVKGIRAANPQAFLILTSPDGRGGYTSGTTAVYDAMKAGGETRIARLTIPKTDSDGCNGHPNTRDDLNISRMFIEWLDAHPEAWTGS